MTLEEVLSTPLEKFLANWDKECLFEPVRKMPKITLEDIETRLNHPGIDLGIIGLNGVKFTRSELYHPCYWDRNSLLRRKAKALIGGGRSFILHNCSEITRDIAELADDIEKVMPGWHTDLHIYVSSQADAATYMPHRDRPQHKIFIQLFGKVRWKIYKHYRVDDRAYSVSEEFAKENFIVTLDEVVGPGDMIYMPPGVFHQAKALEPRVSLSFPIVHSGLLTPKDRTTLSLGEGFQTNTNVK